MGKRIPVPPELEHLIEKRDEESDRRGNDRRKRAGQSLSGGAPIGKPERRQADRRRKKRRKSN